MKLFNFLNLVQCIEEDYIRLYWCGIFKCEVLICDFFEDYDIYFDLDVSSFDFYDSNVLEVWCN